MENQEFAAESLFQNVEKSEVKGDIAAPLMLDVQILLSKTMLEAEKYYAVDYINRSYIRRVLSHSEQDDYWKMKFLHQCI